MKTNFANTASSNDVRSTLTEVGHTAVGLAALAAKRANDARLELAERYEPQFVEARTRALQLVDSVESARLRVGESVDPLIDRAAERLPEPVQDLFSEYRRAVRRAQSVAHDLTVKAIEAATAVPTKRPPRTSTGHAAAHTHEPLVKEAPAPTPRPGRKPRATKAAPAKTERAKVRTTKPAAAKASAAPSARTRRPRAAKAPTA